MTRHVNTNPQLQVAHSAYVWLAQTMTWLNTLVKNSPTDIQNHVVCNQTKNLEQFPFENLTCLAEDSFLWSLASRSWKIRTWRHAQRLNAWLDGCDAEVLHSHFGNHGWENIAAAKRAGVKHVVTFYGYDASRLLQRAPIWRARYAELFETADLFLSEGPFFCESLIQLGCPREKVKVQHLGVELERINFRTRSWQPHEPLKVLLAGSFVEKKGIPYAIKALSRIKGKVQLEITIIGDENGQERGQREKAKILAAISHGGLQNQVNLMGYQPYSVLLAEAEKNHVFLSPSITASDGDSEGGLPVVIIEMAASGMPVLSSFHCDIPEVIIDGKTGLLAPERDVDSLTEKLTWLCDHPERWAEIGSAAREHIASEFDSHKQGERLAAHYRRLVRQ